MNKLKADNKSKIFHTSFSDKKLLEAGMAAVLIFLLLELFLKTGLYYKIAIVLLVINMLIPKFFIPFAILWYGLSNILGSFVSKVVLTIVYFLVVLPVGFIRTNLGGKDLLLLKKYKRNTDSVMTNRNHLFSVDDIEHPY